MRTRERGLENERIAREIDRQRVENEGERERDWVSTFFRRFGERERERYREK